MVDKYLSIGICKYTEFDTQYLRREHTKIIKKKSEYELQ